MRQLDLDLDRLLASRRLRAVQNQRLLSGRRRVEGDEAYTAAHAHLVDEDLGLGDRAIRRKQSLKLGLGPAHRNA